MNRRDQFKPENQCRADGCNGEVFSKTISGGDPVFDRRQVGGNRSPLNPLNAGIPASNQQGRMFPEGSRVVSSFCKKHTCSLFLAEEGCGFKKPIHDTVCALHTKCPIPGCTKAKSQYLDASNDPAGVPKYLRHDFCPDHKCVVSKCPRRRALYQVPGQNTPVQQGRFSTVCQQHHCKAEGCLEQLQEGRNCCRDHQCKAPDCRTIVEGTFSFCAIHIKCSVGNCAKARHLPRGAKEYLSGCELHSTCGANSCSKLRILGSIFCLEHTCQERGCDKAVAEGMYCKTHRCEFESCGDAKSWLEKRMRGKYCCLHTCRDKRCSNSVDSLALFCSSHQCSKERCVAKVLDEQLCIDHFKALYIAKGRGEVKSRLGSYEPPGSPPLRTFSHPQRAGENWRDRTDLSVPMNQFVGSTQPDRRATVSSHGESDHGGDGKHSVISRLSHSDEDGDQW